MKFLLDANIPYSAKEIFNKTHKAIHVRDIGLLTASDEKIIAWAKKNKAALITRDFANILDFPPRLYHGIIVLKIPSYYSAREIKRILSQFISGFDSRKLEKAVVIVEEGRFRLRE